MTGSPYVTISSRRGALYDVHFCGGLIVRGSRDPECDLARALLAQGITGTVTIHDSNTGKPRTIVNIEKAAKVRTVETGCAPRFRKVACAERPPAGESRAAGSAALLDARAAL